MDRQNNDNVLIVTYKSTNAVFSYVIYSHLSWLQLYPLKGKGGEQKLNCAPKLNVFLDFKNKCLE